MGTKRTPAFSSPPPHSNSRAAQEREIPSRLDAMTLCSAPAADDAVLAPATVDRASFSAGAQPPAVACREAATYSKEAALDGGDTRAGAMTDLHSDATVNSSERSSQSGGSSVASDDGDEFGDEYFEDEQRLESSDDANAQTRFLLKPMSSLLQVCPVDDLAVEDEKRRRRSLRSSNNGASGKNKKRTCADAESLPSAPSPLILTPTTTTPTGRQTSPFGPVSPAPQLRRDSMAIRQQYWKQLGFNLSRSDLERTTGRKKERREGLKVRLNDAPTRKGESKNFFQFIASWYGSNSPPKGQDDDAATTASESSAATSVPSQSPSQAVAPRRKSICFNEEAELFYIPLHKDYSKRQRDCMWHTRMEFIAMVERNLEDVYEEMEREYEEQLEAEYRENEAMAREEARQRKFEAEQKAIEANKVAAAAAKRQAAVAAIRARSPSLSPLTRGQPPLSGSGAPANPIPTLSLCPIETQIKIAPRGRSNHDIRFKYLKHLGIQNS